MALRGRMPGPVLVPPPRPPRSPRLRRRHATVLCGVVALSGVSLMQFTFAMVALGAGWNLSYVAATSIVADSHTPEERGKVQAANELSIFSFVATCSFLSGLLFNHVGWNGINYALFPTVGLAALLVIILPRLKR